MGVETLAAIAVAATVVGTGATIMQGQENKKAQKRQSAAAEESNRLREEAERKQQEIADLQAARARRSAAREAQQARATIISNANQMGVSGSSGEAGATGSVQTQGAVNLSFLDQTASLGQQASTLFGRARTINNTPIFADQTWGGVSTAAKGVGDLFSNEKFVNKVDSWLN